MSGRRYLAGVFLILVLLASSAAVAWRASPFAAASGAHPTLRGTDVFPHGTRAFPFALRDQNGHAVTLRSLRGQIVAMTFLDSLCKKECPVAGRELATAQRDIGPRSPLVLLVISVDPARDTPRTAATFVRESGWHGAWHWLFGSRKQLAPVWREYGILVQPTKSDILHTAAVYLLDRRGLVRVADGVPFIPAQLAESVRALATEKRSGHCTGRIC